MRVDGQLTNRLTEIQTSLVEQYGEVGQSAVQSVAEGIDKVSKSNTGHLNVQDLLQNITGLIGTQIGWAIGDSASNDTENEATKKEPDRFINKELSTFTKNAFGPEGLIKAVQQKVGQKSTNANDEVAEIAKKQKENLADSKVENNPMWQTLLQLGTLAQMEMTLEKTLRYREDLYKLRWPIRT